jgi:hypothetical protein
MQEFRITITLFVAEHNALFELANSERRDTRGQAAILVRQGLEQSGLLTKEAHRQQIWARRPKPAGVQGNE